LCEVSLADGGFELDRGELAEGALTSAAVVGGLDPEPVGVEDPADVVVVDRRTGRLAGPASLAQDA
jgi:hypothetical protein